MAAVITVAQAKTHLRITNNDNDGDIYLKLEQANAIVLNYLKSRANTTATIESSSVASPTVITTEEAHGFSNGDLAVIAGHEDSTPALLGSYVVSNVTEFTFTVPVAVTIPGTGGTVVVAWTPVTAPGSVQAAVLLMLTRLYEHRGDDEQADTDCWMAIERLLMRHRDPALV